MGTISPGGKNIIGDAFKIAQLKNGCDVLDVGCGDGTTLSFLKEEFEINPVGIDKSEKLIEQGKEKFKDIDLQVGEADYLEFSSFSFDAVIMECTLSVIEMQTEAIHEAYCLLRPGGKLIITDLFGTEEGTLNKESIIEDCEEIGFSVFQTQDRTDDLVTFTAEKILEHGSLKEYFESITPEGDDTNFFCKAAYDSKNIKYLLLILEKRIIA